MSDKIIQKLQVHQIELEDELHIIQAQLTNSQSHFSVLFNFAPCGYFTLSIKGIILGVNRIAARMLGISLNFFLNRPFTCFVNNTIDDQNAFDFYRQHLLVTAGKKSCELRLAKKDCSPIWVQIDSVIMDNPDEPPVILARVSDIDEKKEARSRFQTLTPREKEVFCLVVTGMLNKQIAGKLDIVEKTVKVHRAHVMGKMKASSFAELVCFSHQM
jgi:PAS domain S-box-containing protein